LAKNNAKNRRDQRRPDHLLDHTGLWKSRTALSAPPPAVFSSRAAHPEGQHGEQVEHPEQQVDGDGEACPKADDLTSATGLAGPFIQCATRRNSLIMDAFGNFIGDSLSQLSDRSSASRIIIDSPASSLLHRYRPV
jgi:hypothetical protein